MFVFYFFYYKTRIFIISAELVENAGFLNGTGSHPPSYRLNLCALLTQLQLVAVEKKVMLYISYTHTHRPS